MPGGRWRGRKKEEGGEKRRTHTVAEPAELAEPRCVFFFTFARGAHESKKEHTPGAPNPKPKTHFRWVFLEGFVVCEFGICEFRIREFGICEFRIRVSGFGVFWVCGFGIWGFRFPEDGKRERGTGNRKTGMGGWIAYFLIVLNITHMIEGAARLWAFASARIECWRCRASRRAGS